MRRGWVPVTGKNPEDPSWKGSRAETSISVANFQGKSVIAIAFNDGTSTNGKIPYTPTTRTVLIGATLTGWAHSEDKAASWYYGGPEVRVPVQPGRAL